MPAVEAETYILDIELEYFRSEKAIDPADPATFYRLLRNAVAVTIATEHPSTWRTCVTRARTSRAKPCSNA